MKAQPSNRLKTEEELAKEEQERLKRLEAERRRRMLGKEDGVPRRPEHTSADDLSDGFVLDKDDRRTLSYKDGRMHVEDEPRPEASDDESGDGGGEGSSAGAQRRAMAQTATRTWALTRGATRDTRGRRRSSV